MPEFVKPPETQEDNDITSALLRLAETIGFNTSIDSLLPVVAELTANALSCGGCLLSLWDENTGHFAPSAAYGLSPAMERLFFCAPVAPDDIPLIEEVIDRRCPVIAGIDEPIIPEALRRFVDDPRTGFANDIAPVLLGMPLLHHNQVIGGMLVIADKDNLGPRELAFVSGIARQTALAVASARAIEEERRRRRDLEVLQETIAQFAAALDLETLYRRVVERTSLAVSAAAAALFLWDEHSDILTPVATHGLSERYAKRARLSSIVVRNLLKTYPDLRPFVIPDLRRTALIDLELVQLEELSAALVIPFQRGDRFMGLVKVYAREDPNIFDDEALALAQALANQAVAALDNAQLYTALRTERERLRALSARLTQAQEAERTRVARELHDEAGQALTAVRLQLDFLASALPADLPRHLRRQVDEAQMLVGRTLQEIRRISIDLRPSLLDDLGLTPALRWQCDRLSQSGSLQVHFVSKQEPRRLNPNIETAVYRAAQEALTNIVRHAAATSVDVILDYRLNRLHLTITDDGEGFPDTADQWFGLGLMGMQERLSAVGGSLHIDTQPKIGTTLFIEVPL